MSDLNSLSREELLELLRERDRKLLETEKRSGSLKQAVAEAQAAEAKAKEAEAKAKEAEAKAKEAEANAKEAAAKAEQKAERFRKNYENFAGGMKKALCLLLSTKADYRKALEEFVLDDSDEIGKSARQALENYVSKALDFVGRYGKVLSMLFGAGSERIGKPKEELEKVKKLIVEAKQSASYSNNFQTIAKAAQSLHRVAERIEEKTSSALKAQEAIKQAMEQAPSTPDKKTETHQGRKDNRELLETAPKHVAQGELRTCKRCGHDLMTAEEVIADLKTSVEAITAAKDAVFTQENVYKTGFCPKCGKVEVLVDENQDFPLFPERQISCREITLWNMAMCNGIPPDKAMRMFEKSALLGNNTGLYSLVDYQHYYLKPLFLALLGVLQSQQVILCDETPFPCMQDQGRGKQSKSRPAERKSGTNYILSVGSADTEAKQVTLFFYSPTRSAANIGEILGNFDFSTLVTDGYAAYITLVRERNEALSRKDSLISHQTCLVHFRREVLLTLMPSSYMKDLMKLPEQKIQEIFDGFLRNNSEFAKLMTVLDAINGVFHFEGLWKQGLIEEKKLKENQTVLMDWIDVLMKELSEGLVEKKGNKWIKTKADPVAKLCVYYLNREEQFRVFLDNPSVPLCTNKVERSIRAVALLRKNSLFKHSPYYMEGMCIAYSVKATLDANGVEDPTEWLNRYNRAMFKHIMEKGLEAQWRSTGELPKSFSIRNPAKVSGNSEEDPRYEFLPEQLTKGFDMKPWLDSIFAGRLP